MIGLRRLMSRRLLKFRPERAHYEVALRARGTLWNSRDCCGQNILQEDLMNGLIYLVGLVVVVMVVLSFFGLR